MGICQCLCDSGRFAGFAWIASCKGHRFRYIAGRGSKMALLLDDYNACSRIAVSFSFLFQFSIDS